MYRCVGCRTAYVAPTPSDEFLREYYSSYHLSDDQGGEYDAVESRMQADFNAKIELARRFAPPPSGGGGGPTRLLDVGCGKGYFVKAAAQKGMHAVGCDLSDSGVRFAVEKLGVEAHAGHIHDLKSTLGIGAFDVATFWATIEHLPDPVGMLRDIHDMLRPGGVLLLDTGIGDDWLDRLLPGRVQWYAPPQHLFVFSGSGFARSVEQAGFQVVHHDRCFDRSRRRRMIRMVRNGVTAALLRAASEIGRLKPGPFAFTRFPLGNLQSIVARKV